MAELKYRVGVIMDPIDHIKPKKDTTLALMLEARIGESFDAIVTGAAPKGTWVRIDGQPVEGRLVEGFGGLDVGDRLRVKLIRTDVDQGFIDFRRLD